MIMNLSTCSPSSSLFRLIDSKSPVSPLSLKSKTHLSKSPYFVESNQPTSPFFHVSQSRTPFLRGKNEQFQGRSQTVKAFAIPGFDLGGFESAQPVLQAAGVLTAIIVVHESGHFLAAYLQGIHVSKFAVGFGPILAKFNSNNVEYSLRAFPLGGFVGFPDNDPDSDIPIDDANLLKNRPIFDRIVVVSAGVVANLVFAFVIIFMQVLFVGLPVQESSGGVLVPDVRPLSAASRGGLLSGDVILGINGTELQKTGPGLVTEVVDVIKNSPNRNVVLKVARGARNLDISVTPDESSDGTGRIGVQLSPNLKFSKVLPKNLVEALNFSGREFWGLSVTVLESLKQTFLNFSQTASKVSGPVAIIAVGAEVAKSNVNGLYQYAAILNLNLAVINLLPLPALDGGTLALILIEAARGGRKLPLELEQRIMSSGIMLVIALGLFLIVRDTLNLDFIKDML
ncbi:probable membrane metalloprotease ARASP2, chloroplastic [Impatiens glandulifera]|uniref:probable membrane metalloprotease ARASP2, chloroplastic n=1 Tax=Impatiens glandulifera TaxID=253017 RepID=UPI001FB1A150|nr:probable membrane metalloprotease ARASP2, chloroplastic [Impatiens glandulifera]